MRGQKDVAVTELKCISVEGDVLPAEFQMHYEFHVANYSDEAIDYLPITIYFNTPDHALVEQDTTTVTGIPAGWYQALEFTFPGVVAGQWMMTLEANKSREIVESNYENNKLSKIFTYINQPELVAESIAEVNGRTDFPLNESTEFEFVLSNLGPVDAEHVPIDFPVTFIDNSGRYSNIMASYVVQNIPAQRRSRAGFNITFQKPALCQMKLRIDKDGTINEISRKNNEVASEWYSIDNFKPNPPTGGDPEEIVVTGMPPCSYYAGGKEYFHPDSGMVNGDWNKDNDGENILKAIKAFYKAVFGVETDNTEKYAYSLYGSRTVTEEGDRFHGTYHLGVDVNKEQGAKVYSAHSGKLLEAKGNHIAIYDSEKDVTYFYLYTQIESSIENNKDIDITKGTLLGKESNVGLGGSNNYHLHFEVQSGRSTSPGIPSRELDNQLPTVSPSQYMNV